eukprot:130888_1
MRKISLIVCIFWVVVGVMVLKAIGEFLQDVIDATQQMIRCGTAIPGVTYGIDNIEHLFIGYGGQFQNDILMRDIIDCRVREDALFRKLQADEDGLDIIMQVPVNVEKDPKKDGVLICDEHGLVYFRFFPFYDYTDRPIDFPFELIIDKVLWGEYNNEGEWTWYVVEGYQKHIEHILVTYGGDFPCCADLVVVDCDINNKHFIVNFKCKQNICMMNVTLSIPLSSQFHIVNAGMRHYILGPNRFINYSLMPSSPATGFIIFGDWICTHLDGSPTSGATADLNNHDIKIEQIGRIQSAIKTHYYYIAGINGRALISGTAKCLSYSQIQYYIRKRRASHKLKGGMRDNIEELIEQSVDKNLSDLQMPATKQARLFFGFFHNWSQKPLSITMYDPVISYLLLYHIFQIFLVILQ